ILTSTIPVEAVSPPCSYYYNIIAANIKKPVSLNLGRREKKLHIPRLQQRMPICTLGGLDRFYRFRAGRALRFPWLFPSPVVLSMESTIFPG
ncbi:MAG: hypothetical protein ACMUIL_12510, partial [bacterium]